MRPFVYVMGPSGAGKDSILRFARSALAPGERIAFVHRYITRPPAADGENHVALSPLEFELRHAAGLFAFHWKAHGLRYGLGVETEIWRRAGFLVVVNGSRAHFRAMDRTSVSLAPVLITAPAAVLAQRLAARGREDRAAITERLQRAEDEAKADPSVTVIENAGRIEDAGMRFLGWLRELAAHADGTLPRAG